MTRSESALDSARLGLLLGLAEAAAILPYDLVQGQREVAVLAAALAWALAIVAVNAGLSGLLGALHRRPSWVTAVIIGLAVGAARAQSQDRFEWQGLLALLPAFGLAYAAARRPALLGLAAAFLAAAGLWARVPIYTSALDERLLALLPGLLLAGVAGAAPISGATARRLGAASLALGLGLGGLVALRPQAAQAEGGAARPNILCVLVDTTRRDHIGPHGERATPATRRLASEGVELADAVTVIPKTTQSVAAYQTGKYPIHNGVRVLKDELRPAEQTLAETLQAEGYRTAAFVHNGWVMRGRGFEQGFDRFWSFFELERAYGPLRLTGLVTALDRLSLRAIRNFDGNTDSAVATDAVIDWLDDNAGQGDPFYVYAHYFDPHWPYRPPGRDGDIVVNTIDKHKVKTKSGRKAHVPRGQMIFNNPLPDADNAAAVELYGAEVDHNTDQVGRILDWLDAHDLARDTIVVFTADHGHHLGDHNYWYHHGELLYEPGIGVPMLLRYPAGLPAGKRVAEQFRSVDVMPTLLALAGLPLPEGLDGLPLATIEEKGAPPTSPTSPPTSAAMCPMWSARCAACAWAAGSCTTRPRRAAASMSSMICLPIHWSWTIWSPAAPRRRSCSAPCLACCATASPRPSRPRWPSSATASTRSAAPTAAAPPPRPPRPRAPRAPGPPSMKTSAPCSKRSATSRTKAG